ncbi:MAG TPA: recombinase RecA [Armatimonadetes bacterium]|jgi:recombination protein RecA|nr:recombinase RecA [Armatimonadota bacterium]
MAVQSNQREDALNRALLQIEKQFGKGSVMRLGERPRQQVEAIPTGCLPLDIALGVGGLPRGRIIEVYGPESSGKTTVALQVIAEAQRQGGIAAFIDAEHALDPVYAANLGVDVDNLLICQPDYGEQALEITDVLVRSGTIDVAAVDSVAALVPKAEVDGEMGDSFVGIQARLMSQALRKLSGTLSRTNTACIFINQLREKIGVMFGNPEVTPGGRALKFWASVRIEVRRIESLKQGTEVVGNRVRAKVVKNKVAPPFREAEFDIIFGKGVSRAGGLLDVADKMGVLTKSGTWWSYGDERIGQGRENARTYLEQHPDVAAEIEARIRASLQPVNAEDLPDSTADEGESDPALEA